MVVCYLIKPLRVALKVQFEEIYVSVCLGKTFGIMASQQIVHFDKMKMVLL